MADLAWIRDFLAKTQKELLKDSVLTGGRSDDFWKAGDEAVRLKDIEITLESILQNLKSSESMLRFRQFLLPKVPRGKRYADKKSVEGQLESVEAVKKQAEALADTVKDLLVKNGILTPGQISEKVETLVEQLQHTTGLGEHFGKALTLQEIAQGAILPPPGMPLEMGGVPVIVLFVYLAVKALRSKHDND